MASGMNLIHSRDQHQMATGTILLLALTIEDLMATGRLGILSISILNNSLQLTFIHLIVTCKHLMATNTYFSESNNHHLMTLMVLRQNS